MVLQKENMYVLHFHIGWCHLNEIDTMLVFLRKYWVKICWKYQNKFPLVFHFPFCFIWVVLSHSFLNWKTSNKTLPQMLKNEQTPKRRWIRISICLYVRNFISILNIVPFCGTAVFLLNNIDEPINYLMTLEKFGYMY